MKSEVDEIIVLTNARNPAINFTDKERSMTRGARVTALTEYKREAWTTSRATYPVNSKH